VIRRKEEIPWAYVLRGIRLSVRVCPDSYGSAFIHGVKEWSCYYAVMSLLLMTVFFISDE